MRGHGPSSKASRASATARSTSSPWASATERKTSSVALSRTSMREREEGSTQLPPMKKRSGWRMCCWTASLDIVPPALSSFADGLDPSEPPEAGGVLADDLLTLVLGDAHEQALDGPSRVRPVVAVVGEIRGPRHVVDANQVAHEDPGVVGDERRQAVVLEVLAGRLPDLGVRPVPISPVTIVEHLEEVRDPAAPDLDERHAQRGKAIEHALEDELRQDRHGEHQRRRSDRDGPLDRRGRLRLLGGQHQMDRHRHVELRCGVPEGIVVGSEIIAARGPSRQGDALVPFLLRALELLDARLNADVRDLEDADQAGGMGRTEAVLQPPVVRADAGEVGGGVGVLHEREHGTLWRIQDLGVDPVDVHQLESLVAEIAAGVYLARRSVRRLTVARPGPLEVFGANASAAHQTERLGRVAAHVDPGVPAVLVLDQLRGGVEVLSLEPRLPQIGRLERMRVRRDDPVRVPRHVELLLLTRAGIPAFSGGGIVSPGRISFYPRESQYFHGGSVYTHD